MLNRKELIFDTTTSKRHKDENGFLHVGLSPISKEIVNPYYGHEIPNYQELGLVQDEIYYGLRLGKELEKGASTFNGLPLLLDHHPESADNPQKEHRVGSLGTDAKYEAPYLMNTLTISDAEAIKRVEDGSYKEISCAYRFEPDFTAGRFNGTPYDFVMRNIRGNHVALVLEGRAGHDVAVADSNIKQIKNNEENKKMATRKIPSVLKMKMIMDTSIEIEKTEVKLASYLKAINAIEAINEGYDPRQIGLDLDMNADIDTIISVCCGEIDDISRETLRKLLKALKTSAPVLGTQDEDFGFADKLEENPEERKNLDSEHEDESAKKDLNEDEDLNFAEGVKKGEELEKNPEERKKLDKEHESEGMKKELGMDANMIKKIREQATQEATRAAMNKMRSLNCAAKDCANILGTNLDPLAFDSADGIYGKALKVAGYDIAKYPKTAYRGMVEVLKKSQPALSIPAQNQCAFDSSMSNKELDKILLNLSKITHQ